MKNILLLCFAFCMAQSLNAQVSISAGTGFLRGFQSEKSFFGLHGGFELPRNNDVTLYGRVGQYFAQNEDQAGTALVTAQDFTTVPYQLHSIIFHPLIIPRLKAEPAIT
jgi:hypothetical protein